MAVVRAGVGKAVILQSCAWEGPFGAQVWCRSLARMEHSSRPQGLQIWVLSEAQGLVFSTNLIEGDLIGEFFQFM